MPKGIGCPVMNMQRDGHMTISPQKGRVSYSPSSLEVDTPRQDPSANSTFHEAIAGDKLRVRAESFGDHFSQALQFFNSQTETEQNHIISAFIFELSKVETLPVRQRVVAQLANVDQTIADRVAAGLGMKSTPAAFPTGVAARTDLKPSPALSILAKAPATLKGRKVGCLVADGTDLEMVKSLKAAAKRLGADFAVIAPKVGGATSADGKTIEGDFQLAGGPSVLFDTVFLALSEDGAKTLSKESAAVQWVSDAFAHLKVIGTTAGAKALLTRAGVTPDAGIITDDAEAYLKAAAAGRTWDREPNVRTIY